MNRLMTVEQFAESLGVTISCVRRWLLERKISKVKLGKLVRIPASECERLISEGLRPTRQHCRDHQGPKTTDRSAILAKE
jgi:excisionase family DNA binding protein